MSDVDIEPSSHTDAADTAHARAALRDDTHHENVDGEWCPRARHPRAEIPTLRPRLEPPTGRVDRVVVALAGGVAAWSRPLVTSGGRVPLRGPRPIETSTVGGVRPRRDRSRTEPVVAPRETAQPDATAIMRRKSGDEHREAPALLLHDTVAATS